MFGDHIKRKAFLKSFFYCWKKCGISFYDRKKFPHFMDGIFYAKHKNLIYSRSLFNNTFNFLSTNSVSRYLILIIIPFKKYEFAISQFSCIIPCAIISLLNLISINL